MSAHQDWTLCLHGLLADIQLAVPSLAPAMQQLLGSFRVNDWPDGFTPVVGSIRSYDPSIIVRTLPLSARFVSHLEGIVEAYEEDDRVWIVDESWGLCEINFLKGTFRSYVLPEPALDPIRCLEQAVLWPLAQLLRGRGIHLVPSASVTKDHFAALLISSFNIEPELSAFLDHGYQLIGQRWTALRLEEGRIAMLSMPGCVEKALAPKMRDPLTVTKSDWTNLVIDPSICRHHAFCDAVMLVEPGRRSLADIEPHTRTAGSALLKRRYPMPDAQSSRRMSVPWIAQVAHSTTICTAHVSRDPNRFVRLMEHFRHEPAITPQPNLQATIYARNSSAARPLAS